jgi:3-oxoacyl-[acyl-carrier protein] reductase
MDLDLSGKRVLITGSSKGIGLAIAQAFYLEGSLVVSNGRNEKQLNLSIGNKKNYFGITADVTKQAEANELVKQTISLLGGIDILICNVGSGTSARPGTEQSSDWQHSLSMNLYSATNMVQAAKSNLAKTKGTIVCISSICGDEVIPGAPITYSAAKAALNAYIRGVSVPLAKDSIKINGVAPGNILFDGSVWEKKILQDRPAVIEMISNSVPLNRLGTPKDVANLVLWLSSPVANFVTGKIYTTDGGQSRR